MPAALRYPAALAVAVLLVCLAWLPVADAVEAAGLAVVVLGVAGETLYRLVPPLRAAPTNPVTLRRVRAQHGLMSRTWLEIDGTRWLPVYFDPALVAMPSPTQGEAGTRTAQWQGCRFYACGRARRREPNGRLIDNPTRPDPDRAAEVSGLGRRLLLDAQFAIAAPVLGLLWVYLAGGGVGAFVAATCVGASVALWRAAVHGSDPS